MYEDWGLIEASFASQYGIRLRQSKLSWSEFRTMLVGILPSTPLGQIVSIRSETDRKIIKAFNKEQKKIYRDWQVKMAKAKYNDIEKLDNEFNQLKSALKAAFGNNKKR